MSNYTSRPYFGTIIRNSDGKIIAPCQSDQDQDFIEYHNWINDGNEPDIDYTMSLDETSVINAVQFMLDSTAQSHGYDNILSLCTYATSTVAKFKAEGQAGIDWRDAVWNACYTILSQVQQGTIPMPTNINDVLVQLPNIVWPD